MFTSTVQRAAVNVPGDNRGLRVVATDRSSREQIVGARARSERSNIHCSVATTRKSKCAIRIEERLKTQFVINPAFTLRNHFEPLFHYDGQKLGVRDAPTDRRFRTVDIGRCRLGCQTVLATSMLRSWPEDGVRVEQPEHSIVGVECGERHPQQDSSGEWRRAVRERLRNTQMFFRLRWRFSRMRFVSIDRVATDGGRIRNRRNRTHGIRLYEHRQSPAADRAAGSTQFRRSLPYSWAT